MRFLPLAALLALALAAVPAGAVPQRQYGPTTDPSITNGSDQRALDSARKQWKARGVRSYSYTLTVSCFCPPDSGTKIVVRSGRPASSTPSRARSQATVPRLFRTIQDAIDRKVAKLTVKYGARGVPTSIYIDSEARLADEEVTYSVRGFAPRRR